MSCFEQDGRPWPQQRPVYYRTFQETTAGSAEVIAIDWTALTNVVLEQFCVHWAGVVTTSETIDVVRDSVDGAVLDTLMISHDPSLEPSTDWVCMPGFRFDAGDHVLVDFPNSEDLTVGVTLFFRQVDN